MDVKDMLVGAQYVVTHESENGMFRSGDRIWILEDGVIGSATKWIPIKDVEPATRGMKVRLDLEWAMRRRAEIDEEISKLENQQSQVS